MCSVSENFEGYWIFEKIVYLEYHMGTFWDTTNGSSVEFTFGSETSENRLKNHITWKDKKSKKKLLELKIANLSKPR